MAFWFDTVVEMQRKNQADAYERHLECLRLAAKKIAKDISDPNSQIATEMKDAVEHGRTYVDITKRSHFAKAHPCIAQGGLARILDDELHKIPQSKTKFNAYKCGNAIDGCIVTVDWR